MHEAARHLAAGFPARWETIFQTVIAALTLAMVFVIQHTQGRHQRATQRKLDEILLVIPGADKCSAHPRARIRRRIARCRQSHRSFRQAALEEHPASGSGDVATQGSSEASSGGEQHAEYRNGFHGYPGEDRHGADLVGDTGIEPVTSSV